MHRFLLHNSDIRETHEALLSPGQVGFMNGWGVFSTIRVHRGVLFEFERHVARMRRDASLMNVPMAWSDEQVEAALLRLVDANQATEATLRVAVVRNRGGLFEGPGLERDADLIAFTAPLHDWGGSVRLAVAPQARHAASPFAGAKVTSWSVNLRLYEEAHERGYDEVVLLNERGEVSECTSANIFAARGSRVLTPPLRSGCLPGVTRELLLSVIRVAGITVEEAVLFPADLESADEVFITSTTRDLLPVIEIEGLAIARGSSLRDRIQEAFGAHMEAYVEGVRRTAAGRAR